MNIEDQLRRALSREPAPADFAASVLARAAADRPVIPFWRRPLTFALAAAFLVAAIVPPSVLEYRSQREQRALQARSQLLTALSITKAQLQRVSARVQKNTRHTL